MPSIFSSSSFRIVFTVFVTSLLCAGFVHAETAKKADAPINWVKDGKWADLSSYIGTYDYDGLMNDKRVKKALSGLLKGHDDVVLADSFAVQAPVGFENDCLILKGNKPKKADTNRAYMEVCLYQGAVNLAVWDFGKVRLFTSATEYRYLSEGLREWIVLQNTKDLSLDTKPDNVEFAKP